MSKLNIDNPVFQVMGRIGDIVLLNLVWLLCCLPVVTIGAATTALFYTTRRMLVEEESCRVCRDFFCSFRQNWRQATILWLLLLAAGVLFLTDVLIAFRTPGAMGSLFRGTGLVLCLLWIAVGGNAFALLARYEYTVPRVLSDAFLLMLRRPASAGVSVGMAALLPIIAWIDLNVAVYLAPLWLLAGGTLAALALTAVLLSVFRQMEERA